MGPLLFIIYINDLPNVTNKLVPILFADDATLLIEGSNIHDIITTRNNELNSLNVWLGANKLSINVSKTHYMVFHRSRWKNNNHNNIFLNNSILTKVNYTNFLGIILDNKLNWINHISYIKNKIAKGMGIVLKARKVLTKKVLLQLYHSFVFPYLIYCSEVWGTASDIHLQSLIKLQKKIVQIINFSSYNSPTEIIFQQLNILPFKKLIFQRLALQMFKYEFDIIPISLHNLFEKNSSVHTYYTRHRNKLQPALAKHAYRDKDFRFITVHVWNYVCDNIIIVVSFLSFKKSLQLFLSSEHLQFKL